MSMSRTLGEFPDACCSEIKLVIKILNNRPILAIERAGDRLCFFVRAIEIDGEDDREAICAAIMETKKGTGEDGRLGTDKALRAS